jgi:hypothetical protein
MKIYSTASMACDSLHILSFLLLPLSVARSPASSGGEEGARRRNSSSNFHLSYYFIHFFPVNLALLSWNEEWNNLKLRSSAREEEFMVFAVITRGEKFVII